MKPRGGKRRPRVRSAPEPTDKKRSLALRTYTANDDTEQETTVRVAVRAVAAEARGQRAREPRVRVRIEDPINREHLEPGDVHFSINFDLPGDNVSETEIAAFVQPEIIIALAKCLDQVIEGARRRGMIPPGEKPISEPLLPTGAVSEGERELRACLAKLERSGPGRQTS